MRTKRQPSGRGVALRDPLPWPAFSNVARGAEALGYRAIFLPEIVGRDAIAALSALGGETREVVLGTGVVPMGSRTPLLTAMGAATVHERSHGRFVLGIGTGAVRNGALEELRSTVSTIRALLRGEPGDRAGREVVLALPPDSDVPIWISAMGPRSFRLAGEIADGVLLNWCTPERVSAARVGIAAGAASVGRDPDEVAVGVYVRTWVGDDESMAMRALKAAAGEYAGYPAYARQFDQLGMGEEARAAGAAVRDGRRDDVPEVLVRAFTAFGSGALGRLGEYQEAGADLVLVYPVPVGEAEPSILGTLRAVAPSI